MSGRNRARGRDLAPAVRRSVWWMRAFLALVSLLTGALLLAVSTVLFGFVHGVEFSPDAFRRRSYFYYELPLVRIQVSPIVRDSKTQDLESYLRRRRIVRPTTPKSTEWDLVYSDRGGAPVEGDAAILCAYLDAMDEEGDSYWLTWSKKHPPLARALWPAVAFAARRRLYLFLPELFRAAQQSTTPAQLQKRLDQALARQYAWLADAQQQLGDDRTALELYTEGLRREPHDEALLRGRERSRDRLRQERAASGDAGLPDSTRPTAP